MKVTYTVTLDPPRHELLVVMHVEGASSGRLALEVPTWVPGDYTFETFARDVFGVTAVACDTGEPLDVRRLGWSGYNLAACAGTIEIRYRAAASSVDFSEECGVLGDRNGVLLGTRYLRVVGHDGPTRVSYRVPDGWAIHHPSGARALGNDTWDYDSYDQLLDSPVSVGHFDLVTRRVRGTEFHHVFLTRAVGFESGVARLVDDLAKVAEVYFDMFGSFPFADYTYVISFNPNDSWGLEHLSSTMVGLDPATFYDTDQHGVSVRVCAHELFHAWNVRRLRPAPLGSLELERGCFSDGLWVAEGFTRYYEFLASTRAGVYSVQQFFSVVTRYYTHLEALPAYARVSPADASAASYLNHEKYPGRANSAIDYYDAGMIIAFETDASLRIASDGRRSLDSEFAEFYRTYAGVGSGYGIDEICTFFDLSLPGLGPKLRSMATEPGRLTPLDRLAELGFSAEGGVVPFAGLILDRDTGPAVASVLDTGPAAASGLAAEDVITSVDGQPYSLDALKGAIALGGTVQLSILRGNQSWTYAVATGRRRVLSSLRWCGSGNTAALVAAWLGVAFDPSPGQRFALDFYENFHGVETVI